DDGSVQAEDALENSEPVQQQEYAYEGSEGVIANPFLAVFIHEFRFCRAPCYVLRLYSLGSRGAEELREAARSNQSAWRAVEPRYSSDCSACSENVSSRQRSRVYQVLLFGKYIFQARHLCRIGLWPVPACEARRWRVDRPNAAKCLSYKEKNTGTQNTSVYLR